MNYKEYYIAFLDILGFSNLVRTVEMSEIHKVFQRIKVAKRITTCWPSDIPQNELYDITKHTKFVFFSDSIVCAIPSSMPRALECVASNCMLIQHALWTASTPVWVRGAIVKGKMYCNGNEMFGPGIVDAYRLEENLAKNPRIIMTRDTYHQGTTDTGEDICFISDTEDGLKMVETLRYFTYPELSVVIGQIKQCLASETDPRIREKYIWARDYFNSCVQPDSEIEEFKKPIE